MQIQVMDHPLLDPGGGVLDLQKAQGEVSPDWLQEMLRPEYSCPPLEEGHRKAVRDLLRHGGYRPAGRGKPSSEWLKKAAGEGKLGSIFPLVELGNAASRMEGLPLSVVDLDRVRGNLRIQLGESGQRYIFNRSDQEIDITGLLCLNDEEGPCANAVKDSQRTKTDPNTKRALILIWGTRELAGATIAFENRLRELAERLGGRLEGVEFLPD
ncbi:MAG: hypothetical protein GWP39_11655 [Planctomycetia bacterium]|nr:hypothetical protein [Planctomycetia bacterium]